METLGWIGVTNYCGKNAWIIEVAGGAFISPCFLSSNLFWRLSITKDSCEAITQVSKSRGKDYEKS